MNGGLIIQIMRRCKYEQNAIIINEVKEEENLSVELLDAAIDNTTLIAGYKIKVKATTF